MTNTSSSFPSNDTVSEIMSSLERGELPCKYLYNKKGSKIFDAICGTKAYYPTRSEINILNIFSEEISEEIGKNAALIEFGSGSSLKTKILLRNLQSLSAYVPLDISATHLHQAAKQLEKEFKTTPIIPLACDYTTPLVLPALPNHSRKIVFFSGSTIGNFHPPEAKEMLVRMRRIVGLKGGILIGVDLHKEKKILENAYNDEKGYTAQFNKNAMAHAGKIIGTPLAERHFGHIAFYNSQVRRIEMHLVCKKDLEIKVGEKTLKLRAGETIQTENSYKYTLESFSTLAEESGLFVKRVWLDPQKLFSVQFLVADSSLIRAQAH